MPRYVKEREREKLQAVTEYRREKLRFGEYMKRKERERWKYTDIDIKRAETEF